MRGGGLAVALLRSRGTGAPGVLSGQHQTAGPESEDTSPRVGAQSPERAERSASQAGVRTGPGFRRREGRPNLGSRGHSRGGDRIWAGGQGRAVSGGGRWGGVLSPGRGAPKAGPASWARPSFRRGGHVSPCWGAGRGRPSTGPWALGLARDTDPRGPWVGCKGRSLCGRNSGVGSCRCALSSSTQRRASRLSSLVSGFSKVLFGLSPHPDLSSQLGQNQLGVHWAAWGP